MRCACRAATLGAMAGVLCGSMAAIGGEPSNDGRTLVASTGARVWIACGSRTPGLWLLTDDAGPSRPRQVLELPVLPEAMAAHGEVLWLLLPHQEPSTGGIDARGATVYRLTAPRMLPSTGLQDPRSGGIEPIASFGASAVPVQCAGTSEGLLFQAEDGALRKVVPLGAVELAVEIDGSPIDPRGGWILTPWPDESGWALRRSRGSDLQVAVPAGHGSGTGSNAPMKCRTIDWSGANGWLTVTGSRTPALFREMEGRIEVAYGSGEPSTPRLQPFGSVSADPRATVAYLGGSEGGFLVIQDGSSAGGPTTDTADDAAPFKISLINAVSGAVDTVVLEQRTEPGGGAVVWWILPLVGGLTVAAVIALIVLRPGRRGVDPATLPSGWEPLPLVWRILAFAIDAIPVWLALAWLREDVPFGEWWPWSFWNMSEAETRWGGALIASLTLSSAIQEGATGTSIGKRLVGAGVVVVRPPANATRTPPRATPLRTVVRALVRSALLIAPALVFLTLIDPSLCGVPEVTTRTAVARRRALGPGTRD
ncbi:MAG: hypothetical protein O2819_01545 [Planctomycetota bacterium]|nr:hypothetical protein [Planctomycetota bacterium]MDA1105033.1 hypothetical protein [Planctomycetota bacterium]